MRDTDRHSDLMVAFNQTQGLTRPAGEINHANANANDVNTHHILLKFTQLARVINFRKTVKIDRRED